VSIGHAHRSGRRNTPSVYNSAGFFSFMWDGRIDTLEQQASAPILNPDPWPVTLENTARAIAAFERKLFARGRWDRFLEGDRAALSDAEKIGFNAFVDTGCVTCHFGPHVGATMFQKLGLVRSWPDTMDRGRFEVTQRPADFMVFRVPSLRNVAATGPYFHDGSISSLNEAVRLMAKHQLGKDISSGTVDAIVIWLKCLTGDIPRDYIAKPTLPESGPNTPPPIPE
jgi:cytochrome c peroxidase